MKCGEILLVEYPFTDTSGSKIRPVLVVSIDEFNTGDDLVFVPLSATADPTDPRVFPIPKTAPFFAQTGLKSPSAVKWTKPLTISRRILRRRLGRLPSAPLSEIQANVRSLFGE